MTAQLIREDRPSQPVAAYHKEKRFLRVLRIAQYPYLELDADATAAVLDQVVREYLSASARLSASLPPAHAGGSSVVPACGAASSRTWHQLNRA